MERRPDLQALRTRRGLTQKALADNLVVSLATVKDWERGRHAPTPGFRPKLARELGVTLDELAVLIDGGAPNGQAVPTWLTLYASLEQGASHLWTWQPVTVHALLQTPAYAAAIENLGTRPMSDEGVDRRVKLRIARQAALRREPEPPLRLSVVLDESVLLRATGSNDVMIEQLDHLAVMAEEPNVDIRILPLRAGVHVGGNGPFTLLASSGDVAQLTCLVNQLDIRYLEGPDTIAEYTNVFERLTEHSLDEAQSVDRIKAIAKEHHL